MISVLAIGLLSGAAPPQGPPLVITDVDVVTMTDAGVLADRTVVIEDGVVIAIVPAGSADVPPDATLVDGAGRFLAPGLIDFHVHLRATSELTSYLRHGVTTVVQLSGALSGAPDVQGYREALARGEMIGPTLLASGPILDGDPPINGGVSTPVSTVEEGIEAVRAHAAAGWDVIKVYNRLPRHVLGPVVAEAHRLGLPVVGHVPRAEDRVNALEASLGAGMDVIAHGEEVFFTEAYAGVDSVLDLGEVPWRTDVDVEAIARSVADAGTAVIPNLSFVAATRTQLDSIDVLWADPGFGYLEPEVREFWRTGNFARRDDLDRFDRRERAKERFLDRLTVALARADVPLLVGTDASFVGLFPGASAHLELRELVDAGLTPAEAFAAGTSVPGRLLAEWGISPVPVGVVAPGARADLVLLERNPLEEVDAARDPIGVVSRGRWLTRGGLDALRQGGK